MEEEKSVTKPETEIAEASSSKPKEQENSETKRETKITEASSKLTKQKKSEKISETEITEAASSKPMEPEKSDKRYETEITEAPSSKPIEPEKSEKKPETKITETTSLKPMKPEKSEKKLETGITEAASSKPMEPEKSKKKPKTEITEASRSKPMEQEKSEKKPENEIIESSSKPPSSLKQTPKSLKARSKIVKNKPKIVKDSPNVVTNPAKVTNSLKVSPTVKNSPAVVKGPPTLGKSPSNKNANEGSNSTPQMQAGENKKRKRRTPQGNKANNCNEIKDAGNLNNKANEEMKVAAQDPNVKNPRDQKSDKKRVEPGKGGSSHKNKEKLGGLNKKSKHGNNKDKKDESNKSLRHGKSAEKRPQRHQENGRRKEDELGGIIFMCNTHTKPDCFRYRVMGVTMGKKDLVLGIKPGIRLFLYDFDRKLLYGIYKATSSGGMKLEPAAFGGAFPAQVRFDVHQDCDPLPERTFKSAIKENYNERNKFKTELTLQQVRRLLDLFRPAEPHSKGDHFDRPPVPRSVRYQEVYEGERESRRSPSRNNEQRTYHHEKDDHVPYEAGFARREEVPHDSFLSEREYRTYGLQRQIRNQNPSPRQRSHDNDQLLRHPPLMYRDTVPTKEHPPQSYRETSLANEHFLGHPPTLYRETGQPQIEPGLHDPFSLSEKEYTTFGRRREVQPDIAASALDSYHTTPYYSHSYGASASYADSYLHPPIRRDEVSSSSYLLDRQRRMSYLTETDHLVTRPDDVERAYLTYSSSVVPDYNLGRVLSQSTNPEATFAPVSSRYAFAGPSSTYR